MFTVSRYIVRRTHYVCRVLRAPKESVFLIDPRDYFATRYVALECHFKSPLSIATRTARVPIINMTTT